MEVNHKSNAPSVVEGYCVYILRTSKNTLYIGQTNNLKKRLKEHNSHGVRAAKYLTYFDSFELVYMEKCTSRNEAMKREFQLKKWSRAKKDALIAGDTALLKAL